MEKQKILLFAGTTEGRLLFENLNKKGFLVDACVATEYGKEIIKGNKDSVFARRLNIDEMKEFIMKNKYELVIDATHPYATQVTENVKTVCDTLEVEHIRLLRKESEYGNVIYCENISEAVEFLSANKGNVLSTIGSKELHYLTKLEKYEERVFARVLPLPNVVHSSLELGFKGSNLICMQGPFSYEINLAMLNQYNCDYLLTKNSGDVGGFDEKIKAAGAANVQVILIGRPTKDQGVPFGKVMELVASRVDCPEESLKKVPDQAKEQKDRGMLKTHFPLFVNISDKKVLVVGAGKIGSRRIDTLAKFNCRVKVIAPEATERVSSLAKAGAIDYESREFAKEDLNEIFIAVAATNSRRVNQSIGALAKERGIHISVADCKEECDFFFPGIIETEDIVVGITAEGKAHKMASKTAEKIRGLL